MTQYILALDQGSSSSRAALVDQKGKVVSLYHSPLKSLLTKPGWVEHRPDEILQGQLKAIRSSIRTLGRHKERIVALGVTNQRSTILLWDKKTGKPIYNAISWQDLRGASECERVIGQGEVIRERTGLMLTPYYSASKIKWVLDHVKKARKMAEKGEILCGTVNTYLLWHLTKGRVFVTDHVNAARTLLFNIFTRTWDKELLQLFDIPQEILPEIVPTSGYLGEAVIDGFQIPIHAGIGDQQASLLGQGCFQEGEANVNYGTGGFLLVNTGKKIFFLPGLLTSISWSNSGNTHYLVEGTINAVGSVLDWLRDQFNLYKAGEDPDELCKQSKRRVYLLPAISGLGAPHWDNRISTCLFGLDRLSRREDVLRAAVEAVAFLVKDNFEGIHRDGRIVLKRLSASGGLSSLSYLAQFQADILRQTIHRSGQTESTLLGVAYLAGLSCKFWSSPTALQKLAAPGKTFYPRMEEAEVERLYERWKTALRLSREWAKNFF
ncbi:MAG: glycerol kinase GlpK [Nitrospirae bacterium]|nr:glycerol kinase GlpK [Nitrospirota bacterium]